MMAKPMKTLELPYLMIHFVLMLENVFALQNAYSEGLSLPAGEGFTLDTESLASLADIDR